MFTKEADLRDYLAAHPETVSAGCSLIGKEIDLDGDRLDLMLWSQTVSMSGRPLYGLYVVELKLGKLSDGDLAQVLTYARIVQEASCQYCFDATYKNPGWYRDRPTALRRWENAVGFGDEESCIITPMLIGQRASHRLRNAASWARAVLGIWTEDEAGVQIKLTWPSPDIRRLDKVWVGEVGNRIAIAALQDADKEVMGLCKALWGNVSMAPAGSEK